MICILFGCDATAETVYNCDELCGEYVVFTDSDRELQSYCTQYSHDNPAPAVFDEDGNRIMHPCTFAWMGTPGCVSYNHGITFVKIDENTYRLSQDTNKANPSSRREYNFGAIFRKIDGTDRFVNENNSDSEFIMRDDKIEWFGPDEGLICTRGR